MLEPWIIEQIRRREEEERQGHQRPRLEIPTREEREGWRDPNDQERERDRGRKDDGERESERERERRKEDHPERGVTIIDFGIA